MKILLITNLYPPHVLGGYEILCGQVVAELARRGHALTVLTSRHGVPAPGVEPGPVPVHRTLGLYVPFNEPGSLARRARWRTSQANRRLTARILAAERPDVVFVWSLLRLGLGPAQAAEATGLAVAYSENDPHLAGYLPVPWSPRPRALAGAFLDRTLLRGATLPTLRLRSVTCISRRLRDNLVELGVPVAEAQVIYQGIPVDRFPCKPEPGRVGRPPRLLYVGQVLPYKGVHTLLEAAHRLADTPGIGAVHVDVVGTGPEDYRRRLEDVARSGPAEVTFHGRVSHDALPERYRAADVFVFPSTWQEPFGLTHLEAMASGPPVVSTADGGHGEFLRAGENALIFPGGDAITLAEQLRRLVTESDLGPRLATTARAEVAERFSIPRYVTDLEAFLTAAVRARQATR